MAHLPADMTDTARRHPIPVLGLGLVEQSKRVVAGEDDLVDGELNAIHRVTPFLLGVPLPVTLPASCSRISRPARSSPSVGHRPQRLRARSAASPSSLVL